MKIQWPQWFLRYKALPKERRALIRQTILVLIFFVILGFAGAVLYRMQREGFSAMDVQKNIQQFFGK